MLLTLPNVGSARDFPALIGDTEYQECQIAKGMADWAFESTLPDIKWPDIDPADTNAQIVLSRLNDFVDRSGSLISGGYTLYDAESFEGKEPKGNPRNYDEYYWQRVPQNGKRLVVWSSTHSWRGNWFFLFYLDQNQRFEEFFEALWSLPRGQVDMPSLLQDDQWQAPTILKNSDEKGGAFWLINQRHQHAKWGIWDIMVPTIDEMILPCWIDFVPDRPTGLEAMPVAVRRFALLADEALGPGTNEGTLQPTARIRSRVEQKWALISERPWALTRPLYNTRDEVDGGLAVWADQIPARAVFYRNLKREYKRAEPQLANFLTDRFGIEPKQAERYSAFAMDYMLRSYFVFHSASGGRDAALTNPWPKDVR
ncbi:hypothetical protein [Ruegeria atlantica]|uniref:hypothetical protein n=1 Tax=Ruegeria atlantica TaxID=81569 RepID=UPI002493F701|nr:hypothetical protein [Ruegeria atlantica]